jgi:hypothetical protein
MDGWPPATILCPDMERQPALIQRGNEYDDRICL